MHCCSVFNCFITFPLTGVRLIGRLSSRDCCIRFWLAVPAFVCLHARHCYQATAVSTNTLSVVILCYQLICLSTDFLQIRVHTNIIVEALIIFGKIFRFLFFLSSICRNSYLWLIYDIGAVHLIPEWNAFQCVVNIINPLVLTSPLSGRVNITIELMLTKCVVVGSKLSLHPLLKIIEVATWLPLSTVRSTVWLSRMSRDGTIDIE